MSAHLPLSLSVRFVSDDALVQSYMLERLSGHPFVRQIAACPSQAALSDLSQDVDVVLWDVETASQKVPPELTDSMAVVCLCDPDASTAEDRARFSTVRRDAPPDALVAALAAAVNGFWVMDRAFLNASSEPSAHGERDAPGAVGLTAREREVLNLIAEGLNNRQIAEELGVSVHTAKFHIASILDKLDATSRTEAVVRATRLGWLVL